MAGIAVAIGAGRQINVGVGRRPRQNAERERRYQRSPTPGQHRQNYRRTAVGGHADPVSRKAFDEAVAHVIPASKRSCSLIRSSMPWSLTLCMVWLSA